MSDENDSGQGTDAPAEEEPAIEVELQYGVPVTRSRGQLVLHPDRASLIDSALRRASFAIRSGSSSARGMIAPSSSTGNTGTCSSRACAISSVTRSSRVSTHSDESWLASRCSTACRC